MPADMNAVPRYRAIFGDLSAQIKSGELKVGDRIESESQLAVRYGVSRMTVRQAVGELETEGLVVRRHGSGTFVHEPRPVHRKINRLSAFHEEIGVDPSELTTRVLAQAAQIPPKDVACDLQLTEGNAAVRILRLRSLSGEPIALQESWMPLMLAPSLARVPLVGGSLYRTLAQEAGIELSWAEQQVTATLADAEQARLLRLSVGDPLMRIQRKTYAAGLNGPVESACSFTVPSLPLFFRLEC